MENGKSQQDATLLDVLIDGFEKNEAIYGFHSRDLPMPDEPAAMRKFDALTEEATRWKGPPARFENAGPRRIAAWPDLEIRQSGRGIMVRVRTPWFRWWYDPKTWDDEPMGPIYDWLNEERSAD